MSKKSRDILYGIVLILFSIANIIYANVSIQQEVVSYTLARPDRYMQIWLVILLILSVIMIIRAIRKNDDTAGKPILTKMAIFTVLIFFAFLLVMPKLGYEVSAFIFLAAVSIVYGLNMGKPKKTKKEMIIYIIKMLVFAGLMTFGTSMLFRKVLGVRLPKFKLW